MARRQLLNLKQLSEYPACWSVRPNGIGRRCSHRRVNTSMAPRSRS
jgi:hypothetical protein